VAAHLVHHTFGSHGRVRDPPAQRADGPALVRLVRRSRLRESPAPDDEAARRLIGDAIRAATTPLRRAGRRDRGGGPRVCALLRDLLTFVRPRASGSRTSSLTRGCGHGMGRPDAQVARVAVARGCIASMAVLDWKSAARFYQSWCRASRGVAGCPVEVRAGPRILREGKGGQMIRGEVFRVTVPALGPLKADRARLFSAIAKETDGRAPTRCQASTPCRILCDYPRRRLLQRRRRYTLDPIGALLDRHSPLYVGSASGLASPWSCSVRRRRGAVRKGRNGRGRR